MQQPNPNQPPVKPEKDIPAKPDTNPDPTKQQPGGNEPKKNDPTRITEPPKADPTRIGAETRECPVARLIFSRLRLRQSQI